MLHLNSNIEIHKLLEDMEVVNHITHLNSNIEIHKFPPSYPAVITATQFKF